MGYEPDSEPEAQRHCLIELGRRIEHALTPTAIHDELPKVGFMPDQERRAELERLLAPIRAGHF